MRLKLIKFTCQVSKVDRNSPFLFYQCLRFTNFFVIALISVSKDNDKFLWACETFAKIYCFAVVVSTIVRNPVKLLSTILCFRDRVPL